MTLPWGGLDIEMTQDGRADVDRRQAMVDEVGDEQAAEVVRGQPATIN
jgi:hypothetical protein